MGGGGGRGNRVLIRGEQGERERAMGRCALWVGGRRRKGQLREAAALGAADPPSAPFPSGTSGSSLGF